MSKKSMLNEKRFWEIITYLTTIDQSKTFQDICSDLSITKSQLNSFIHFLKEVDYAFQLSLDQQSLRAPVESPVVKVEFTLLEWLQFQASFPHLQQLNEQPYFEGLQRKFAQLENEYSSLDLFAPMETLDEVMEVKKPKLITHTQYPQAEILSFIEESILEKQVIGLQLDEGKINLHPRKISCLNDGLSIIGEDCDDKGLVNINFAVIQNAYEQDLMNWKPVYSQFEVDEFVAAIKAIEGNLHRLVLKVHEREEFLVTLPHYYLENPCMVTNPQGDLIWAASVTPNEVIFKWLHHLGRSVEILDPQQMKKQYLEYCEGLLKKLA